MLKKMTSNQYLDFIETLPKSFKDDLFKNVDAAALEIRKEDASDPLGGLASDLNDNQLSLLILLDYANDFDIQIIEEPL
jgi:hypothetical protein